MISLKLAMMHPIKSINTFIGLSMCEQKLIVHSFATVCIVKLGLWTMPLPLFRRYYSLCLEKVPRIYNNQRDFVDKLVWAVTVSSIHFPFHATCLVKALTLKFLLSIHGYPSVLRIGVRQSEEGEFKAHAWLERNNEIIIGKPEFETYKPLWVWDD